MEKDFGKDTSQCTWKLNDKDQHSPHITEPFVAGGKKIYDDVLDAIGNTPMIRLNRVGSELGSQCQFLAKCEFMNMGGSIKDRIGRRMILDAQKSGRLKKGDVIVEATSGNTGIGLSLAAAVKGYQMIITLPQKMSNEKVDVLKGLGAKVIRTPTEAASQSPESNIGVAKTIRDTQGAILLDQYSNPSNPLAHYDATAEEILYQCDGKVDAVVVSVGTGGAISGIARKIKEKSPSTLIVGIDPHGSILAMPQTLNGAVGSYKVEGIGYDFIPRVLDRSNIDHWVKTSDVPSFKVARDLIQKEGLLVGGSSGSTMWGAAEFAKQMGWGKDKRIVVVMSDSVRNYITKFLSKQWCIENKMLPYDDLKEPDHAFNGIQVSTLNLEKVESYEDLTVGQAKALFQKGAKIIGLRQGDNIVTAIHPKKFMQLILLKKLTMADSAKKTQTKDFVIVPSTLDCAQLERLLERNEAIFVEQREGDKLKQLYVATAKDLLQLFK